MDTIEEPGTRVRHLRIEKNWSMERLAREAAISKQTLIDIELCRSAPQVETLRRLATALGVGLVELLGEAA